MDASLEPLEKMFQKVEEESERRAQEDADRASENAVLAELQHVGTSAQVKSRRRGSISITRFGELVEEASKLPSSAPPTPPLSVIASKSPFYQLQSGNDSMKSFASGASAHLDEDARRRGSISITRFGELVEEASKLPSSAPPTPPLSVIASKSPFYQLQSGNDSMKSFASGASAHLDEDAHREQEHATQMLHIAGRQSISKTVTNYLPRRLSRARSTNLLVADANVVIGVSVEEATVESPEGAEAGRTVIHAPGSLRNQTSRLTMPGALPSRSNWIAKAKSFALKLRRKTKGVEPIPR
ncbi:hypothetical protein H0H92_007714 [Tricholoma furcatifolium]|nr:hypothetical protein H0H92_007714 [Tricholoma furcatifolium]